MNKVYNVIWSDAHQAWVACAEIDSRGRKKTSRSTLAASAKVAAAVAIMGAGLAVAPATASTCGGGTTVASGGSCDIGTYSQTVNDNKVGAALVNGGDTVTLIATHLRNQLPSAQPSIISGPARNIYTDPVNAANLERERVLSGQQGATVTVQDPASDSNQTVNYYNNVSGIKVGDIQTTAATGADVYVDARLATASGTGSKVVVNLGDGGQASQPTNSVQGPNLEAKQTRLVQAENGGSVDWTSNNRIVFATMRLAENQTTTNMPVLKVKTVELLGTTYTIDTIADLKKFNDDLVDAIGQPGFANPGETQQAAYNRRFNEAATTETVHLIQSNTNTNHPDASKPIGERWVMAANGAGSTATLKAGANLEHRVTHGPRDGITTASAGASGGMLAEAGGRVVVEAGAKLSGHYNNIIVRNEGSVGDNHGVISGGYYHGNDYDTSVTGVQPAGGGYVESDAVVVNDSGKFNNYGIINIASFTYPNSQRDNRGISVLGGATATNKTDGVINVAVNTGVSSSVDGAWVGAGGTFNTEQGSTIYIGRAAQYEPGAPTVAIDNTVDQVGIRAAGDGAKVNHDGTITIGEKSQGAIGILVENNHVDTTVTVGTGGVIEILGNATVAGGQPKQNVGIQLINSGDALVTNSGAINVMGTNGVGQNLIAENGQKSRIVNTATSKITVDETNANVVTRNYGIFADGQGTGTTEAVIDGLLNLQGDNVIGAHARGNSTFDIQSGTQATFANGKNQIAYHISGGKAVANVAAGLTNPMDVATQNSVLFRADAGGTVNATGTMNVTASGADAIILASNGKASNITASANNTYKLTGNNSSVINVSGGAQGTVAGTANVASTASGVVIGTADGRLHDLTNQPVAGTTPVAATKLTSSLNTTTTASATTGYSAEHSGTVEYNNATLDLNGAGSIGVQTVKNGTAELNNAIVDITGNALLADTGTNRITVNSGNITGSDNVFNSVAGINTLTANNNAVLNGTMALGTGTSTVNINSGATWNNTGNSVVTDLNNNGMVAFAAPAAAVAGNYKTITVNGDYASPNGGQLVVNTLWNNDTDKDSDHLIIDGTATGSTVVTTRSGIIGNITQSNAQQFSSDVITVKTPQPNAAGQQTGQPDINAVFTGSANTTNAGQAQLVLKSTANGQNVYAWTLYASPTPTPTPTPGTYIYASPVAGYLQMPLVNQEMGYVTIGTLHERRGENQVLSWDNCGRCGSEAKGQSWGRILGQSVETRGKERFGFDSDITGIQIGHDFAIRRNDKGGHNLTGVYLGYTHGSTDFSDQYRAVNGVVSADKFVGEGKSDAISLGITNTYYAQNGSYLDLVGQVSWLRNKYQARNDASVKQNGWGAALSVEVGRPFALGGNNARTGGWMIEPQAQLVYQYTGLEDFNDGIRQVDQNNQHGLRGRVGMRLAHNSPNGNLRTNTFYAVANVWQDFLNPKGVDIGLDTVRENRRTTWGEVGLGAQLPLGNNAYLYGDARYAHSFAGGKREAYRGTVGFKYNWK